MVAEPWFTQDHFPSTDGLLNSSSRGEGLPGGVSADASKAVPRPAGPCRSRADGSSCLSRRRHVVRTRTVPLPDFAVQRTAASEETAASAMSRNIVRLIVTTSTPGLVYTMTANTASVPSPRAERAAFLAGKYLATMV